jgi:hypothetical protein
MNIICFLTLRPNKLFYDFCKTLKKDNYDIYICIDDSSHDIPEYDNIIKIIKIDKKECEDTGFKNSVLYFKDQACSRDKALYYFCKNDIDYKYIWFIEEDVFLPTSNIILDLDNKYPDCDLLCRQHRKVSLENYKPLKQIIYHNNLFKKFKMDNPKVPFGELIKNINIGQIDYTVGMISAIRMSKNLMNVINDFVSQYNTLFIDEVMFTTLSYKYNLSIITPTEFNTILFNKTWTINDIDFNNLYHPIKDINKQYQYRKKYNTELKIKLQNESKTELNIQPIKMTKKVLYYKY